MKETIYMNPIQIQASVEPASSNAPLFFAAAVVVLLTTLLAVWVFRRERRRAQESRESFQAQQTAWRGGFTPVRASQRPSRGVSGVSGKGGSTKGLVAYGGGSSDPSVGYEPPVFLYDSGDSGSSSSSDCSSSDSGGGDCGGGDGGGGGD
jgi:hypothetical protein